jgi:6-phosphogluconolactonase
MMLRLIHEKNQDRLLLRAARHFCEKIRAHFALRTQVNVALPGGRNVVRIFEAMRAEPMDWQQVHFFMVDERLVPIDHPDSNFKLLQDHLVSPLVAAGRIPAGNAHPFMLDTTRADRGALHYERVLVEHGFRFDVILLSSGEDGHVGALYPHHHAFANGRHGFLVMDDSPKPPPGRMTSSLSLMQSAQAAVLLFVGEAKREAFEKFNDAACPVADCPAKLVLTIPDATVFTDLN